MVSKILLIIGHWLFALSALFSSTQVVTPVSTIPISTSTPTVMHVATTTPVKQPVSPVLVNKVIPKSVTQIVTPQKSIPVTPVVAVPPPNFDAINIAARKALVNILCTTQTGGGLSPISGSGVVISPDGVIVTNAHVAQYFLLQNFNGQKNFVQCIVRTGSPAYPTYLAKLVYISPQWVMNNSTNLVEQDPTGTGEHDYAFLKITASISGTPLGTSLSYLAVNVAKDVQVGDNILLASYPAGFLGGITIENDLNQSSAITQVSQVFTFDTNTTDLISVPGTVVSQKGSSGGAAVNAQSQLEGIISTATDTTTTSTRDLRAIRMDYINRDLSANASISLQTLITNADVVSADFNQNIAPALTTILTKAILGN